jgi:hypothetical protein
MDVLDYFKKYHYHAPLCCGYCKYQRNTLSYAKWAGYYYCDHPDLKDIEPGDKMIGEIGICDNFKPRISIDEQHEQ